MMDLLSQASPSRLAAGCLLALVLYYAIYHTVRAIYLLYFSPLSIYPGHPVAAVSEWWELWHNIGTKPGKRGQTTFLLEKMHRDPKYGVAIRVHPDGIAVSDPRFYHKLYNDRSFLKAIPKSDIGQSSTSTAMEQDPVKHKIRRGQLEPLFSRRSILRLETMVMENIDLLCARLDEFDTLERRANVEWAIKSVTMDTISKFCLGKSFGALRHDELHSNEVQVFTAYLHNLYNFRAVPYLRQVVRHLPLRISKVLSETTEMGTKLHILTDKLIGDFTVAFEAGITPPFPTLMERMITSNPDKGFLIPSRESLIHEVTNMISAGFDTTAVSATVGLFQILQNPDVHSRLLAELKTVLPHPTDTATLQTIEKLPYLTAVLKETLRIGSVFASRMPRIVPKGGVALPDGRFLPAGSTVGMSAYIIHHNEDIFPSPKSFIPERWLEDENNTELGNLQEMNKFLIPFSRGPRSCIGINLAWMELYLVIAYLVRRFDFESTTTKEDMQWEDMIIAKFYGEFTVTTRRRAD